MAYTYHTVESASQMLNQLTKVLAETRLMLKADQERDRAEDLARGKGCRRGPLRYSMERTIEEMERRREFLTGELEKAKENERLGIPPMGPETTDEWRAKHGGHDLAESGA